MKDVIYNCPDWCILNYLCRLSVSFLHGHSLVGLDEVSPSYHVDHMYK